MALDINVVGANLDANGNIKVALPNTPAQVGSVRAYYVNDAGSVTGSPSLASPEVSQDHRLRVGADTLLFTDTFNATTQNTGLWKHAFTTMTMTQGSGFLNVNAAGTSTVANNFAYLQSWRYFGLMGTAPIAVEFAGAISARPIANEVFLCGLGVATGAAEPVDGCWFELTSAGLKGCVRYNSGVVTKVDLMNASGMPINQVGRYSMVVGESKIEWWVNQVLFGTLAIPAAQGQPYLSTTLPLFIQKHNSNLVGSSPNMIVRVSDITVLQMDLNTQMAWANQMASCGLSLQGLNGGTMGSPQVQWANTALPTAAAATNTTAALGAFLGGIFQMNAPATSATDVIVASYQNPLGGVNQTPRTMKLRGIKIDCCNSVAAVATTASVFAVALAWGATQLSLGTVTADSGSFVTATAKARRIQPLGIISFPVGAAIGAQATPLQFDFEAPVVINPGEFVQVIVKILLGTATATEVFQWVVSPNLYHE